MSSVKIRDIVRAVDLRFPPERAESWDRVGLLAGNPERDLTGVVLALDPTLEVIAATATRGANVLVTHHPAFLEPPATLQPGHGPGGVLFAAIDAGIALVSAHTNLDRDEEAQMLLPSALGLTVLAPLESSLVPMSLVAVYTPDSAAQDIASAMQQAGAGRIGDYIGCTFTVDGVGTFTPAEEATPSIGSPGLTTRAGETRLEMVAPPHGLRAVVSAATSIHPYEEPLITATDIRIARNSARLGMICATPAPTTLGQLASLTSEIYGVRPRVWGDPGARIERVATSTGSAGALIGDALRCDADALVAGEVRYHDALEAKDAGLCVVELGHDVTEWPLVGLLDSVVRSVPGIDSDMVHLLPARAGWWTT